MKRQILIYTTLFSVNSGSSSLAQNAFFKKRPQGRIPREVAEKQTHHYTASPYADFTRTKPAVEISYSEVWTNKKNDRQYYLERKRIKGDMQGRAPVLWCAYALLN